MRHRRNKPICGVSVMSQDPAGRVLGAPYLNSRSDLREREYVHKLKGERWGMILTEVARRYPFPEVKGFIPEGFVWLEIAKDYDDLTASIPLRIYHAGEPDALSRIRLTRGKVMYYRAMIFRDWMYAWHQPWRFAKAALVSLVPLWIFE